MSDCACSCDLDYDRPDFFRESDIKKSRKEYKCEECGEVISAGSPYRYECGSWEGKFQVFRTCKSCIAIRIDFCPCFVYGMLWENMMEHWGEDAHLLGYPAVDRYLED